MSRQITLLRKRLSKKTITKKSISLSLGLVIGLLLLLFSLIVSLSYGVIEISIGEIWRALLAFDGSTEQEIIRTVRLPRSVIAILVGASLAIAGGMMQGLTQNPLASPDILGMNAGAAFSVVTISLFLPNLSLTALAGVAFIGSALSAIAVYGLGSLGRGGLTPLNLTIAGAALTAFFSSLTSGILILNQRSLAEIRFWLAGSVAGRDLELLWQILPYLVFGSILALILAKQVTILSFGEQVAKGLGQNVIMVKIAIGISITLLSGASVAIAGPISFVGLVVPHIVRLLLGFEYLWLLPYSAICGAVLLLNADVCARLIFAPLEIPVGLIMPLLGAPFFIYLIRWKLK